MKSPWKLQDCLCGSSKGLPGRGLCWRRFITTAGLTHQTTCSRNVKGPTLLPTEFRNLRWNATEVDHKWRWTALHSSQNLCEFNVSIFLFFVKILKSGRQPSILFTSIYCTSILKHARNT